MGAPKESGAPFAPIALTKLRPPVARVAPMTRPRLFSGLDDAVGTGSVVSIVAPAGSGKTTLVADWTRTRAHPVAWVHLDPRDNDPVRFWTAFLMSLAEAEPRLGNLLHLAKTPSSSPSEIIVPRLINECCQLDESVVIVLDDLHVIEDKAVLDGTDALIRLLPAQLSLVVLSRHEPAVGLNRVRVEDRLTEYRMSDLLFTRDEAWSFMSGHRALPLAPDLLDRLWARTEGWAAGLQLAASSLARSVDAEDFVERLDGDDRLVVDYLTTELLSSLGPELKSFLVETSILETLNGSLCDAVRNRNDSIDALTELDSRNVMLVPLDQQGAWFRYHHLLGRVLRSELEHDRPETVPELHRRAARWFADNGFIDQAIDHAIDGRDFFHAGQLIERNGSETFSRGEMATVERWLDALDVDVLSASPTLTLLRCWVHLLRGEVEQGEWWLSRAEDDIGQMAPGSERSRVADIAIAPRITTHLVRGDVGRAAELARRVTGERPAEELNCVLAMSLGSCFTWAGDHDEARALLARAIEYAPVVGQHLAGVAAMSAMALVELSANEQALASHHAKRALAMAEEHRLLEYPQMSLAHAVDAMLAGNDVESGLVNGARAVELAQRTTEPLALAVALASSAAAHQVAGRHSTAVSLGAEARSVLRHCPDAGFASVYLARVEARFRLPPGGQPTMELVEQLTPRELALLRLMPGTMPLRELATELTISHNTAKTYAKAIYRKLGASGRQEAVARARDLRLL